MSERERGGDRQIDRHTDRQTDRDKTKTETDRRGWGSEKKRKTEEGGGWG